MYRIREAETADIPTIVRFRLKMFRQVAPEPFDPDYVAKFEHERLKEDMKQGAFAAWVAETGAGRVVACSALTVYRLSPKPWNLEGLHGYISSMYTEPDHRRKGLGGRLLDAALDRARKQGLEWVTLHASKEGRSLYSSGGFEPTNEMRFRLGPVRSD